MNPETLNKDWEIPIPKLHPSYVSRVLRMTLLAPEIVEAILAGRQPVGLTMTRAMRPFPVEWVEQTRSLQAQCDPRP